MTTHDNGSRPTRPSPPGNRQRVDEQEGRVGTLSASRVAQIRDRIATGFYDDPSVARAVAHGLADSGHL